MNPAELMQKFNAAFYDATTTSTDVVDDDCTTRYLLDNLDDDFFSTDFQLQFPIDEDHFEYVNLTPRQEQPDEGFSEAFSSELVTPASDCTTTFDYDDFSLHFEQFNPDLPPQSQLLPPVNTISKHQCNWEFGQFLRHQEGSSLNYHHITEQSNDFGHAHVYNCDQHQPVEFTFESGNNLLVCNQTDALRFDEGATRQSKLRQRTFSIDSDFDECVTHAQCKWAECYQMYDTQSALVRHIEKAHVEVKRGDEFTCYWHDCPRKTKPFNARYKLLIHMRVHSGEKPNKCPFNGCNKAFSRLENLKIHQRSHTGERPYLCQFPTCAKSFSNSSDRAKHQRTHFDTKPYACQVQNCNKKYTDPSSLRKHVKNHTPEEQMELKAINKMKSAPLLPFSPPLLDSLIQMPELNNQTTEAKIKDEIVEHDYTNNARSRLKNKLSEKLRSSTSFCMMK